MGLEEGLDEDYLRYRLRTAEYLASGLEAAGVGFVRPPAATRAIDARTVLPHMPVSQYPGWALALALYLEGGIAACEIGSVMFGKRRGRRRTYHTMELVRLAFPRRMYTQVALRLRRRGDRRGEGEGRLGARRAHRQAAALPAPLHL